jgi:hypothetical protein
MILFKCTRLIDLFSHFLPILLMSTIQEQGLLCLGVVGQKFVDFFPLSFCFLL